MLYHALSVYMQPAYSWKAMVELADSELGNAIVQRELQPDDTVSTITYRHA